MPSSISVRIGVYGIHKGIRIGNLSHGERRIGCNRDCPGCDRHDPGRVCIDL